MAIKGLAQGSAKLEQEIDRRFAVGLAISLSVLCLMGFTVAFFGGALPWYYALVGIATTLSATFAAQPRSRG